MRRNSPKLPGITLWCVETLYKVIFGRHFFPRKKRISFLFFKIRSTKTWWKTKRIPRYLNFYEKIVRILGEQSEEEKRKVIEIESIWHWSFESTKNKRTLNVLFGFFLLLRFGGVAGVCAAGVDGMEIFHKDLSLKQWKKANNHGFLFVWITNSIMQPSLSFSLSLFFSFCFTLIIIRWVQQKKY